MCRVQSSMPHGQRTELPCHAATGAAVWATLAAAATTNRFFRKPFLKSFAGMAFFVGGCTTDTRSTLCGAWGVPQGMSMSPSLVQPTSVPGCATVWDWDW